MRIGIILTGDYTWAGGLYYSLNIIKLLHSISSIKKVEVVAIVNSSTPIEILAEIPQGVEISSLEKKSFFYKLRHKITGNRFATDINHLKLDILYPLITYEDSHNLLNCRVYYWLYDFQHKFLPGLFSAGEIVYRDANFEKIATQANTIVFSSLDSRNHFDTFYPASKSIKHVYNFVSLIDKQTIASQQPANTFPKKYFIVCNQFWPHKNHITVLRAAKTLISKNSNLQLIFTGKYDDKRNAAYFSGLNNYVNEHQLGTHISYTGFISREEQLQLMKNAIAVIQPSLFEGWSTVVEDAKALNKFLILSDLPVHREQVKHDALFFPPEDDITLSKHLLELLENAPTSTSSDYQNNIDRSKIDLVKLFNI